MINSVIDIFISPAPDSADIDKLSQTVKKAFPGSNDYISDILSRRSETSQLQSISALLLLSYGLKSTGKNTDSLTLARTPSGKPYLTDRSIFFSISHDRQAVAVAISDTDVGVDIQSPCSFDVQKISDRFFEGMKKNPTADSTDINCADINCTDINCADINCTDINCTDINCTEDFYVEWTKKEALCKLLDIPLSQMLSKKAPDSIFFHTFTYQDCTVSVASKTPITPNIHIIPCSEILDLN